MRPIRRFEQRHQRLPNSLPELVDAKLLTELPHDPIDDQPMRNEPIVDAGDQECQPTRLDQITPTQCPATGMSFGSRSPFASRSHEPSSFFRASTSFRRHSTT